MAIAVGLPLGGIYRLAADHPYTNQLIEGGASLHILLGPEKLDRVGCVQACLTTDGWRGDGKFALYVCDFDSEEWRNSWMRLAGYTNHDKMPPGLQPNGINPIAWPNVLGSPGMLWEFRINADSAEEFKRDLCEAIDQLWKFSFDVIRNTADEYAFNMASTCFSDLANPSST